MTRAEKANYIEELRQKVRSSGAVFLTEYQGIKAVDMNDLRRALREERAEWEVVKNTLARLAVSGTPAEGLSSHLEGPVAFVFSYRDAAVAAKKLTQFAKDQPRLVLRAGFVGKVVTPDDIKRLAELPSKEVLLAKLLGSLNSPTSGLVCALAGIQRKLLYALKAVEEKKSH